MISSLTKRAGWLILAAALAFLAERAYSKFDEIAALKVSIPFVVSIAGASVVYGFLLLLLVIAFGLILTGVGVKEVTFCRVLDLQGRSNIAKRSGPRILDTSLSGISMGFRPPYSGRPDHSTQRRACVG